MDLRMDLALYFPSLMEQKRRKQKARAKRPVCKSARLFSAPGRHDLLSGNEWILLQAEAKQPPRNLLVIGYVQRGDNKSTTAWEVVGATEQHREEEELPEIDCSAAL